MLSTHATLFVLACFSCANISADIENSMAKYPASNTISLIESGAKVLRFNKLTIDDGLTTSEIKAVVQDKHGYIWIATSAGLNRYDGSSVKQYLNDSLVKNSLSNNYIYDLVVDSAGQLWIATSNGLNRYNETDDTFIIYRSDANKSGSINSNSISSLFVDSKLRLWIGTRSGFNRYVPSTDSFVSYQPDIQSPKNSFRTGRVKTFYEDHNGMIWIGTTSGSRSSDQGLTMFDPESGKFTHFDHDPEDDTSLPKGSIFGLFQSADKRMWIASYLGGLSEYIPSSKSFRRVTESGNLTKRISKVFVDSRGIIWLLTEDKGLLKFDHLKNLVTQYSHNADNFTGLSSNSLASIFEDKGGLLWIGSVTNGLNILDYRTQRFNHIIPSIQLPEFDDAAIRSINELDDETIVLGTSRQGIVIYNPLKNSFAQIFESSMDGNTTTRANGVVHLEDKKVLVGTNSGVYILNLENQEKHLIAITNSNDTVNIVNIYQSKDGLYWLLSAGKGLFSLDLEKEVVTAFPYAANNTNFDASMLSSYYPRDIFEDDEGYLWIASIRGLNRFDRKNDTFKHYVHDENNPESLPENKIFQITAQGNHQIWLATNNGLILFDKDTEKFRRFTTKDGLPNNNIYCMVGTDKYLWLGTNSGISRWSRKDFTVTNYFKEDGLQSNEFNTFGCAKGNSGNLYFAGINGFNYFKAEDTSVDSLVAPLIINEVKLEDEIVPLSKKSIIEIPYDNRFIQLEFRVLNYSASQHISYQIKLENFDKEWRDIGKKNNTIYTNLSAGEYTFRVLATNQHGINSKETTRVMIKKSHPLRSNFAMFIYIVVFLSLVFLYNIYHRRQLTKLKDIAKRESKLSRELRQLSVHLQNAREEERANVARELHDELAQILVAIKLEISWIQSALEKDNSPAVLSRMPEIQGVVDACVESVRNMATGLRPPVLDDMGLIPALEWYVGSACQRAKLRISFTTNCETIHLSNELSINIYRIVQEAVTNVIKHANARKLSVSCYLKEQNFHLRIRDDGAGINESDMEKKGHYGLMGIRERVATYDGTVIIGSNKPSGTVIDVTISVVDDLLENFPAPELN